MGRRRTGRASCRRHTVSSPRGIWATSCLRQSVSAAMGTRRARGGRCVSSCSDMGPAAPWQRGSRTVQSQGWAEASGQTPPMVAACRSTLGWPGVQDGPLQGCRGHSITRSIVMAASIGHGTGSGCRGQPQRIASPEQPGRRHHAPSVRFQEPAGPSARRSDRRRRTARLIPRPTGPLAKASANTRQAVAPMRLRKTRFRSAPRSK